MDGKSYSANICEEVRDGKENPFWTIEALGEHVQACWGALGKMGMDVWEGQNGRPLTPETMASLPNPLRRPKGEPGTIVYHLRAIEEYHRKVLNVVSALLPDISRMADQELTPEEREEVTANLNELADFHQSRWDAVR